MHPLWKTIRQRSAVWIRVTAYTWLLAMFGLTLSSALQKSPSLSYLAHFNEAVGGAQNDYEILVDSNVDWESAIQSTSTV